MNPTTIGFIGLGIFVLIMMLRMPIAWAMALVGFIGFSYLVSLRAGLHVVVKDVFSTLCSYELSVIPLFVLMGNLAYNAGIGSRLYKSAHAWLGHLPGGLAIATMGACAGFGACTGSGVATAATMAKIAIPEMKKYNYDIGMAAGCVAAGGTLGLVIPPSVALVIYGVVARESIGRLFMAGIFPGLLIAFVSSLTIYIITRIDPSLGPRGAKSSWKKRLQSLIGLWEVICLFFLVMGGLFSGLFTPTEAGAVGAFGAFVIALARRQLTMQIFLGSLFETLRISCMVLVLLLGAGIFTHFIVVTKIPMIVAAWTVGLPFPPLATWMILTGLFVLIGCFIETLPVMIICIPIFAPVALAFGYDLIWFGVYLTVALNIGMITPPVGINCFVIKGVMPEIPLETIFRGVMPFTVAMIIATIILIIWPQITLFLPNLMK